MKRLSKFLLLGFFGSAGFLLASFLFSSRAYAATCDWTDATNNHLWGDSLNWNNCNGGIPSSSTDTAAFNQTTSTMLILVDDIYDIGSIETNDPINQYRFIRAQNLNYAGFNMYDGINSVGDTEFSALQINLQDSIEFTGGDINLVGVIIDLSPNGTPNDLNVLDANVRLFPGSQGGSHALIGQGNLIMQSIYEQNSVTAYDTLFFDGNVIIRGDMSNNTWPLLVIGAYVPGSTYKIFNDGGLLTKVPVFDQEVIMSSQAKWWLFSGSFTNKKVIVKSDVHVFTDSTLDQPEISTYLSNVYLQGNLYLNIEAVGDQYRGLLISDAFNNGNSFNMVGELKTIFTTNIAPGGSLTAITTNPNNTVSLLGAFSNAPTTGSIIPYFYSINNPAPGLGVQVTYQIQNNPAKVRLKVI